MSFGGIISEGARTFNYVLAHPMSASVGSKLRATRKCLSWYVLSILRDGALEMDFVDGSRLLTKRKVASRELYWTGLHEFHDMAFVAHCLRPDETFVDVGANVGAYSVLAAKSSRARCVAFEPAGTSFELLERNVALNDLGDRIDSRQCAVGAEAATVHVTSELGARNMVAEDQDGAQQVEQVVLDSLLDEGLAPTVIKVDVEGYETNVFNGAKDILSMPTLQALLVEAHGHGAQYGFDERELHETIVGYGFTLCGYLPFDRDLVVGEYDPGTQSNSIYVRNPEEAKHRVREADQLRIFNATI
ncbi:MAG: FkbM family methyltransferase [Pirellulales bacterium]